MPNKKVVFISGPITGVERYWEPFERAEENLQADGFIALSPAHLPLVMAHERYMRICFSMIESADAVLFLPGWSKSKGSQLEYYFCEGIRKPTAMSAEDLLDMQKKGAF